jgi:ABC-type Fe3+ transport system permease subunit
MNKFFLVVRIVVLVALLFLLAAVFWGVANRDSTQASDGSAEVYEQYQRSKPAGYTSILLIALVVLGIFVVLASIFFEYHQVRKGTQRTVSSSREEEARKQEDARSRDWQ